MPVIGDFLKEFDPEALSRALYSYVVNAKVLEAAVINNKGALVQLEYLFNNGWISSPDLMKDLKAFGVQANAEKEA